MSEMSTTAGSDLYVPLSRARPLHKAKQLKRQLRSLDYEMKLTKCQNVIAQMYGCRHLDHLFAVIDVEAPSPGDEDVSADEFARRFWLQVSLLVANGVSSEHAEEVVDTIRPTGGSLHADSIVDEVGNMTMGVR